MAPSSGISYIAYKLKKAFFMVIIMRLLGLLQTLHFPSGLKYAGHPRGRAKKSSLDSTAWDILSVLGYVGEELF